MDEELACICCLDDVLKRKKYFSCLTCTSTYIDSKCKYLLQKTRDTCPTCSLIKLTDFKVNINENPKPVEIIKLAPMKKEICPQCEKLYGNLKQHLHFCKAGSCPFCKKANCMISHLSSCSVKPKDVILVSHLLKSNGFFQTLKKHDLVDLYSPIRYPKGLFVRKQLKTFNENYLLTEGQIVEITDTQIVVLDLWFNKVFTFELEEAKYYIAPYHTYLSKWRETLSEVCVPLHLGRAASISLYQKYSALKKSLIEFVEKDRNNNLTISLGYIIGIDPSDSSQLVVNFGNKGILSVDRFSTNIRPCGLEPRLNESIQIIYDSLFIH